MGRKVLITGGAGFIGSHLCEALLKQGHAVAILDNLSSGNLENLSNIRSHVRVLEGDIRNTGDIDEAMAGCDTVFHLAAMVLVPQTVADPVGAAHVNEIGALNVLDAARKNGCRRVVLASSAAVYGSNPELPKRETMTPEPLSPYAVQKLAMEHYAGVYTALYGLETVCLRFFNVFGPRQDPSSPYSGVISIFLDKAFGNAVPAIFGDGQQTRDFIHVQDVVQACRTAMETRNGTGQVFNIGTGRPISISRLWEAIASLIGTKMTPGHLPERSGDVRHSVADIGAAMRQLAFSPAVSLEDGLRDTAAWYQRQRAKIS